MKVTFDLAKDAINIAKHGLSLADFVGFDSNPMVRVDARFDYGETRYRAFGRIGGRPYMIVYIETARHPLDQLSPRP